MVIVFFLLSESGSALSAYNSTIANNLATQTATELTKEFA